MAWLLTWFIFAQSTLMSYHTEAFVKTEVGCTVLLELFVHKLKIMEVKTGSYLEFLWLTQSLCHFSMNLSMNSQLASNDWFHFVDHKLFVMSHSYKEYFHSLTCLSIAIPQSEIKRKDTLWQKEQDWKTIKPLRQCEDWQNWLELSRQ